MAIIIFTAIKMRKEILLLSLLLILPLPVFALELQLNWPRITLPGIGTFDIATTTRLHDVARYFYYAFVMLGGVIGFIGLVAGGILWLTSAGNLRTIAKAKKQIWASFIGLLIILFSWLILYTLDPQLVIFPFFEEAVAIPPIQGKPKQELQDGIIFYVKNHPILDKIEVPGGLIHVEDTRRFPVGDTTVNLSGRAPDGHVLSKALMDHLGIPYIDTIEIRPHSGLTGPTEDQSRYGVACFEYPHYKGAVRLFIPPLRNARFHRDDTPEFVIPRPGINLPCGSILVFKIPQPPPIAKKWSIRFYQYPFPKREKKVPTPLGKPKREIVGECIDYYVYAPSGLCNDKRSMLGWGFNYFSGNDLVSPTGVWLNQICNSLESMTPDGEHWYPRSMELPSGEGAAKYLVFLFPEEGDIYHHWDRGDAYWFESDVKDFYDEKDEDKRIYWKNLAPPDRCHNADSLKECWLAPKSCIIIPVKTIY